jgi:hypothetical protein
MASNPVDLDEVDGLVGGGNEVAKPPFPKLSKTGNKEESSQAEKGFAAMMGVGKAMKAFKKKVGGGKKDNGADNAHSAKKDAFLIDACAQGSLNLVIKFITENGCSPNLKGPDGKSLVQIALEGGHEEVVM